MSFKLYDTLSREIKELQKKPGETVSLYTCGPTVYFFAHIGHFRKYSNDDFLKRALLYQCYKVKHVQNVTDVGHLVSDADEGEDKMEKGAKREGKTVWELAKFYENHFYNSLDQLNVLRPSIIARATEHIAQQISLVEKLFDKGFAYETDEAVYFDITKFPHYGELSGQKLSEKEIGVREDVYVDPKKKNPHDFALWIKRVGQHKDHTMHWDSPWDDGFPGWHIECSAMSMEYLGPHIDIHTGGIDHIPVHHENEIAQSEAATGEKFVDFWVHHEFLVVDGIKMSKSLENFYTIEQIKEKGFDPMALRYLFLTAHYRQKLNFTWEGLKGAENSLNNLRKAVAVKKNTHNANKDCKYGKKFEEAISDDLNMPKALAVVWEAIKDEEVSYMEILDYDKVLGLKLDEAKVREVPKELLELAKKRDLLRSEKKFNEADEIRKQIEEKGFEVEDTKEGTRIL